MIRGVVKVPLHRSFGSEPLVSPFDYRQSANDTSAIVWLPWRPGEISKPRLSSSAESFAFFVLFRSYFLFSLPLCVLGRRSLRVQNRAKPTLRCFVP